MFTIHNYLTLVAEHVVSYRYQTVFFSFRLVVTIVRTCLKLSLKLKMNIFKIKNIKEHIRMIDSKRIRSYV